MAFTFLAAQGYGVGASLLQEDQIETCKKLLEENGDKIVLPTDVVIADAFSADAAMQIVGADGILDGWLGLDIGPESAAKFAEVAAAAATVFWNGPMGVFELAPFAGRHPRRSPRRSPRRRRSRWSAAAIPPPRSASSASTNPASPTSRPAVARPWSSSRAKSSPAWQFWRHDEWPASP